MNKGKQEGITLIALIITIIIMLILVAVTVNVAMDGNLFGKAEEAVDKTNAKVGKLQQDIDYYTGELNNASDRVNEVEHNWTRNGETFRCLNCRRELKMGQQIMYTNTGTSSSVITMAKTGYKEDQTITKTSDIKWVVFGIEDSDGNGTNESLLITTVEPTEQTIKWVGMAEYNNGENELNRVCRELYGNKARSMTIEDVNNTLQYNPEGAMYGIITTEIITGKAQEQYQIHRTNYTVGMRVTQNSKIEYKTTGNFTTKIKELEIWDELKTNLENSEIITPDGVSTIEMLGNYNLTQSLYKVSAEGKLKNLIDSSEQNIETTTRNLIFGNNNCYKYNLASKVIGANNKSVEFGLGSINYGSVTGTQTATLKQAKKESTAISSNINHGKEQIINVSNTNITTEELLPNESMEEYYKLCAGDDAAGLSISEKMREQFAKCVRPVVRITDEPLTVGGVITQYGNANQNNQLQEAGTSMLNQANQNANGIL